MLKTKTVRKRVPSRWLWQTLKIGLAIGLVGYVLAQTSLSDLTRIWGRVRIPWLLASATTFLLIIWAMARRYWTLIDKKITLRQTLGLVVVQTVVGNLFASSAGAVSYVALLRSKHQIQISQGVASIIMSKFGDLLALLVALGLSSWAVWADIPGLRWMVGGVLLAIAGVVLTFVLVLLFRQPVLSLLKRLLRLVRLDRLAFVTRTLAQLDTLVEQDARRMRVLVGEFVGYSGLIMLLSFVFGYCNMQMFGLQIGLWAVLFISSLTQLISIIPIQVFGGLGIFEITTVYLYNLFRIDQQSIMPVVVSSRIYLYLLNVLLIIFWLLSAYSGRRASA
jgi:uncharacterized membrane protein YbhN (UPF0104 family)